MEQSYIIRFHDLETFSLVEGDGPAIVMLHGWSATGDCWRYTFEALKTDYRVVAPDLPGHGRSSGRLRWPYGIGFYRRWLEGLLDALDIGEIILMGNSMGGAISLDYALAYPNRVSRIVVANALGMSLSLPWRASGPIVRRLHHMLAAVLTGKPDPHVLRFLDRMVFVNPWGEPRDLIIEMSRLNLARGPWASWPGIRLILADFLFGGRRRRFAERLHEISAPTLIVWGQQDAYFPPDGSLAKDLMPDAKVVLFEHSAHLPMMEEPERFNALVRDFLNGEINHDRLD